MKKMYKTKKSWVQGVKQTRNGFEFIEPFIPKNSGIVVVEENNGKVTFYHQGHNKTIMDTNEFSKIPKEEFEFSDEFIFNYIIPGEDIKNLKKIFKKIKKTLTNDPLTLKSLETLSTWIFSTKGSTAIKGKEYGSLDFNNLPWVNNSGFSAKPYAWHENRSGRTTITPSEEDIRNWENDPNDVLPIGIKQNEHCTYTEMFKIGKKLLQEMCGINGVSDNFKKIVKENFPDTDLEYIHRDYLTNDIIFLEMFVENTHHGKTKGLELCHKRPDVKNATSAEYVTIGLHSSNRSQSGNSLQDMAINGINGLLIEKGKSKITVEKLIELIELI